eukprot:2258028-Amphidinium_carterae.7
MRCQLLLVLWCKKAATCCQRSACLLRMCPPAQQLRVRLPTASCSRPHFGCAPALATFQPSAQNTLQPQLTKVPQTQLVPPLLLPAMAFCEAPALSFAHLHPCAAQSHAARTWLPVYRSPPPP